MGRNYRSGASMELTGPFLFITHTLAYGNFFADL
jgi:hypothetical protein